MSMGKQEAMEWKSESVNRHLKTSDISNWQNIDIDIVIEPHWTLEVVIAADGGPPATFLDPMTNTHHTATLPTAKTEKTGVERLICIPFYFIFFVSLSLIFEK